LEISPYKKEYIVKVIKEKLTKKNMSDDEIEKYYSLFDGNMAKLMKFLKSQLSLKGFLFNYI